MAVQVDNLCDRLMNFTVNSSQENGLMNNEWQKPRLAALVLAPMKSPKQSPKIPLLPN